MNNPTFNIPSVLAAELSKSADSKPKTRNLKILFPFALKIKSIKSGTRERKSQSLTT